MRTTDSTTDDTSQTLDKWGRAPDDPNYGVAPGGGNSATTQFQGNGLGVVGSGTTGTTAANGGLVTYDPAKVWPGQGGPGTVGPTGQGAPLSNATPVQTPPPTAVVTPPPTTSTNGNPFTGNPTNRQDVLNWVQGQYSKYAATNPDLARENPPEYWVDRILENGGLNDPTHGAAYWDNRMGMTTAQWNQTHPDNGPAQPAAALPGAVAPTTTATPAPIPTASAPATAPPPDDTQAKTDALYQALLKRAQQSLVVDPNDPAIKGQTDAYNVQDQRARMDYLRGLAEQQGPNGNIGAETRASAEKVGQDVAGFQGTLVSHELQSRRDEIQQALTSMQGMLSDEQKLEMQKQLDDLDNAVKYAQINEQGSEFTQQQGQQDSQFGRSLAQQLQLAMAQLNQQAFQYDQTRQDNVVGGV